MIETEKRRSIRKYLNRKVEEDKIAALLESARLAPSGMNTQPWHFIIIDDKTVITAVSAVAHDQKWLRSAPLLIACVADIQVRIADCESLDLQEDTPFFELKQVIRDTAIAVEHIALEAVHQGLGTCWVAWFLQNDIRPVLGIPKDKFLVAILAAGYPDENPAPRPRKKMETIVHRNRW